MENTSLIFSILFIFVCVIYSFLGIYILYINPKGDTNRTFFAACVSLSIWAFGFSLSISSPNMESSLFWRRFAAVGWGSIYSILLHFSIILAEKKSMFRKWWAYILLYLPAAVIIYVYAVSSQMSLVQYHLVKTSFGWKNIEANNIWDWFFNVYYAGFMAAGLGILWYHGRNSANMYIKKRTRLIIISSLAAFLFGTMTDIIFYSYLSLSIPQIAPIINLIPVMAIYYSIRWYGLMNSQPVNKDEIILTEYTRIKIYNYLSIAFIFGGFLNFVSLYLLKGNARLLDALYPSTLIFFTGLIIQIIQRSKLREDYKDIISISTISLAIPIIILRFAEYGSITVWAFPFILVIISLVFNKRIALVGITVSTLLTQVLVWVLAPHTVVEVGVDDYIARICLFIIAIWLAFRVNKVYLQRLKENAEQIGFQRLISEISSDFVTVNQMNMDEKIYNALKKSGEFLQVDRSNILLFNQSRNLITVTYEWCNEGITPNMENFRNIPADSFPWWINKIMSNEVVYIPDMEILPAEPCEEKKQFSMQNLKSLMLIPVTGSGTVLGFLGFQSVMSKKVWRDDHINLLKIIANIVADAMAKVDAEKEINYMAYYDHLTKLPNRQLFKDRVDQAILLANRKGKMLGVIFIDLDLFKTVNDTIGHEGGDELLTKLAQQLTHCVRKSDTVSRFGGDEFLVMINYISNKEHIVKIADNIMALFKNPFMIKGQEFFITASAGIAVYPDDGEDTETLIKNADIAMYNAKEKGKNQYLLCSSNMKDEVHTKIKLTNGLYRALERNELMLHYQPQISLQSKEIVGFEALIRWNHPELGIISPGIFISLAEQTGLINSLGEWALKTACRQNKAWQDMGLPPVRIAVNLSVNQFRDPNLVDFVDKTLRETGLNPKYLELEITESIVIKETSYIINVLNRLKKLGISISIDDFGMDYSSLSRLKMLPVDRIKIAMQFVHGIEENDKDKAIAKVIINLAKNLGLKVIAEGVETWTQLEFLEREICDEMQGYYYYKPMPAEEAAALLESNTLQQG